MATYYVSNATGDDADTGLSEALAFKTIQKALDTVAAGDTVHIKGDGNYSEALAPTIVGTSAAPIWFSGYSTTPGDEGLATVDGGGTLAIGLTYPGGSKYHIWSFIRWTDFTSNGIDGGSALTFRFCEVDNNGSHGIECSINISAVACHIHNNGGRGFTSSTYGTVIGCTISNNSTTGIWLNGGHGRAIGNTVDGNLQYGIVLSSTPAVCVGNTVYGNSLATDVGIYGVTFSTGAHIIDNIVTECGVGIKTNKTDPWENQVTIVHNVLYGNTTNYEGAASDLGELLVDPLFVDAPAGDFTLDNLSPVQNVGVFPAKAPNAPSQVGEGYYLGSTPIEGA